jgi:uncharacterized protein YqfA (UPF0365 family)
MTVRTDLEHMVEGVPPEELERKMAEAVVEQVQKTPEHDLLLDDATALAERVYRLHLDRATALTVESVDVVDVQQAGSGYPREGA